MAKENLIGSDGKLVTVTYGDAITGPSGTIAADGWHEITGIAESSSDLPANSYVGMLVWLEEDDTLASGDSVKPLVEKEQGDVTSFNLEISKPEIDVTTLSDGTRRYRSGKIDMTGQLEGITTLGATDATGWVMNNFLKMVKQASVGTVTVTNVDDAPIYLKGVLQKDVSAGEKESFFWAKVNLLGTSLGASGEDAQNFSSNFRIAPGDPEPTFYVREIAGA